MVKSKSNPLIHSNLLSTHAARIKRIHITHTPPTLLIPRTTVIPSTSAALDTIHEPHVPLTCPALTTTTPHISPTPALLSTSRPHGQTKDDHMTTDTTQGHSPFSKSEIHLIKLQVYIYGIKNKLEELKLFIHTHADMSTFQETKLIPKANTPNVHTCTSVRVDRLYKAGCMLITLIRENITFTTTGTRSTINTHNTQHITSNGQGTY